MDRLTPVRVLAIGSALVAMGAERHSCALGADGRASCWGDDGSGRLGNGPALGASSTPTPVDGLTDAVQLETGGAHTCVVRANGRLACWGFNRWGQLGDGTTMEGDSPVEVVPPP